MRAIIHSRPGIESEGGMQMKLAVVGPGDQRVEHVVEVGDHTELGPAVMAVVREYHQTYPDAPLAYDVKIGPV